MTKYVYDLYVEGNWLHKSDEYDSYEEAEEEARNDIVYEASLEDTRCIDDYSFEISEVESEDEDC